VVSASGARLRGLKNFSKFKLPLVANLLVRDGATTGFTARSSDASRSKATLQFFDDDGGWRAFVDGARFQDAKSARR
jgi:hypothetical protein